MNITLSADEEIIKRAQKAARRQGKSLNQMIREYMRTLAMPQDGADSAEKLFALMDEGGGTLSGKRWTRDEAHKK
ncbi:MAG: ribbon-helix-helix protein, CopG family [Deltaproteobacteria bacterium]|nr:ribbon-helix-helix protein, CopG family [Deltaproteobacteria bacterium]